MCSLNLEDWITKGFDHFSSIAKRIKGDISSCQLWIHGNDEACSHKVILYPAIERSLKHFPAFRCYFYTLNKDSPLQFLRLRQWRVLSVTATHIYFMIAIFIAIFIICRFIHLHVPEVLNSLHYINENIYNKKAWIITYSVICVVLHKSLSHQKLFDANEFLILIVINLSNTWL